jgi:hypothetical protein
MSVNGSQEYGCKICGKKLGDSLGDRKGIGAPYVQNIPEFNMCSDLQIQTFF